MRLIKLGEKRKYGKKELAVGQTIMVNDDCPEYKGLTGWVVEIRTDESTKSRNIPDEIYVCVHNPKTIGDVSLTEIIFPPDVLIPMGTKCSSVIKITHGSRVRVTNILRKK